MRFHYTAVGHDGKIIEGDMDGRGSGEVLFLIANKGLKPLSIKEIKQTDGGGKIFFGQSINIADKIFLTRYLALMLKVGTDLLRAVDILLGDFSKPSVKNLLFEIKTTLEKGQPFHVAFSKYPKYFPPVFVNLVKAGEASGNLEDIFMRLSVSLEKEQELRNKIKAAITYPIILFSISFLLLILLVVFALPRIAKVFTGSGVEPPTFSKIVFGVGLFFGDHIFIFIASFLCLVIGAIFFFRSLIGKRFSYAIGVKIPAIGTLMKKIALQRFASIFGSLIRAGLPIMDALEITADAVGFEAMKTSLIRISREGIAKGLTIGEAFRRETIFPSVFINLIAISEKAGHTEEILDTLSSFYESEIESSVKNLTAFLEPALLLGMGFIIGLIALAVIVPVYQFVGNFS